MSSAIDRAIDDMRVNRTLVTALTVCALVMIIDGFDLAAMPMTVPYMATALSLAPADFGPALAALPVGMGAGAVLLGPLGDRLGRRPVAICHLLLVAVATLGTATASTHIGFLLWRLLTGLGLGGCLPNITALVAEISPRRIRARMITATGVGASVGGFAGGLVIPPLVAAGGWHAPFLFAGGAILLLAVLLLATLPESPKFYAARRPDAPAFGLLARRLGLSDVAEYALPVMDTPKVSLIAIFEPRYRLATAVFATVYTVNAVSLYMLSSWLSTILPRAGFSLGDAARLTGLMQAGGLFGGVVISIFLDRGHAARSLVGAYVCVLVALASFSVLSAQSLGWGALLLVVGGGITGGHLALLAVGASLYPSAMLTSAFGFAVAVARVGAVGGPLIGQLLVARGASAQIFLLSVSIPVLICIAGLVFLAPAQRSIAAVK